ncbi:MAG: zinc-ribbon domain-containing protein, partial [Bacilli bacterium]|nr:zinc-ribbon domain-containing protein [Bacilli bacterium]
NMGLMISASGIALWLNPIGDSAEVIEAINARYNQAALEEFDEAKIEKAREWEKEDKMIDNQHEIDIINAQNTNTQNRNDSNTYNYNGNVPNQEIHVHNKGAANQKRFCTVCGTQVGANAKFCPNCGNPIESAQGGNKMGFLGFKSKAERQADAQAKERKKQQEKIHAQVDNSLNPAPYLGSQTNQKKRDAQNLQINKSQEQLRDEAKEAAKELLKEVNISLQDDNVEEEVQNLMMRIGRLDLGKDTDTSRTIVSFFVEQITQAKLRAQEGNLVAVSFMVQDLDGLLSEMMDHRNSSTLFINKEYVDRRLRISQLASLKEGFEAELLRLYKKRDSIKALMEAGKITPMEAQRRLEPVKADVAAVKNKIQSNQDILTTNELALRELRDQLINTAQAQEQDLASNETILANKADSEARSNEYASQRNQFRTNDRAVDDNRMQFNETSSNETEMSEEQKAKLFDF